MLLVRAPEQETTEVDQQRDPAHTREPRNSRRTKHAKCWRIVGGNINSLPIHFGTDSDMKRDKLKQYLTSMDCDIVLLSEHNTNGDKLETRQQPRNIFKGFWDNTITRFEWLRTRSNRTSMEPGGTAIITNGTSSAHTIDAGGDKKKLGRWNWITVRGRERRSSQYIDRGKSK